MARARRTEEIKVRVTDEMKQKVLRLADQRGETESVIVREALLAYLARIEAHDTYPGLAENPGHHLIAAEPSPTYHHQSSTAQAERDEQRHVEAELRRAEHAQPLPAPTTPAAKKAAARAHE